MLARRDTTEPLKLKLKLPPHRPPRELSKVDLQDQWRKAHTRVPKRVLTPCRSLQGALLSISATD